MFRWKKKHTADGRELPDTTPIQVNMGRPLTIAEQLARFAASPDFAAAIRKRGMDTFDEADDFDVPDMEPDERATPYEREFHGAEMPLRDAKTRLDEINGGMTEEMPVERVEKVKKWFKKPEKPASPAPGAGAPGQ